MEELSLPDIMAILKRRRSAFFVTAIILFAISLVFSLRWSNYRASATVEIEPSFVSENVTTPIGGSPQDTIVDLADQRISQIEQRVTSLETLAEIITKFNLFPGERDSTPISALTDRMRKNIKVDFLSSKISNPAAAQKQTAEQLSAIAFVLSFDYSDPHQTQLVADELVTRFLDEDLKQRRTQAEETSAFLGTQIEALEKGMADQEKTIAEFRAKNGESGPSTLMFNQQAAANANISMQSIDSQITSNEGTQGTIRAQLALVDPYSRVIADGQVLTTPAIQLKALESQYATLTGQYGPNHPDVIKASRQIAALKAQIAAKNGKDDPATKEDTGQLRAQIADLKTNLAAAESTNGADHPDVIALKKQLAVFEARLAKAQTTDADSTIKKDADNPAYLELAAQLKSAEEQHKSLIAQREALRAQQEKYEKNIAENPAIEQQMATLNRDYDNSQLRYRELKEKKMAADMTEQLETDRKGQRLVVINPPALPETTHPQRLMLVLGGLALSLIGGIGSVVVVEAMSQSVHGANHLASLVGAPPLVVVPHIFTEEELQHSFRLDHYALAAWGFVRVWALEGFIFVLMILDDIWIRIRSFKPSKKQ